LIKSNNSGTRIRILFLADTHIGLDWPVKPRIRRRRRGDDLYNNYLLALKPALKKQVDLVIHGGDLLNRSRLPQYIINRAFEPLLKIADQNIPVYVVPGNHEKSAFRLSLFEKHPSVFLFDHPRIFPFIKNGSKIYLCGLPFIRGNIRSQFPKLIATLFNQIDSQKPVLLCLHHPFDGAKVGPKNFTFFNRPDTINPKDIPFSVDAVLSGHIHRHQVLYFKDGDRQIPVIYPGSIERTSFVEQDEDKGYSIVEVCNTQIAHTFIKLPARPMYQINMDVRNYILSQFESKIDRIIREIPPDSILRIKIHNYAESELEGKLTNSVLRRMTPYSMNVDLLF
jgi:exonuclease SbcD